MRKILLSILLILGTLFFSNSVSAEEYGGWTEDEGYYQNDNVMENDVTDNLTSIPSHSSDLETKIDRGEGYERVVAKTAWPGEYHYSRAWYQHRVWGGKSYDSGRVWGTSATTAKSSWAVASITITLGYQRKTAYGK